MPEIKKTLCKDGYLFCRVPGHMQREVGQMAGTDFKKSDITLEIFELGLKLYKEQNPKLAARIKE